MRHNVEYRKYLTTFLFLNILREIRQQKPGQQQQKIIKPTA